MYIKEIVAVIINCALGGNTVLFQQKMKELASMPPEEAQHGIFSITIYLQLSNAPDFFQNAALSVYEKITSLKQEVA